MGDTKSQHFCPYCGKKTLHVMNDNAHGCGCVLTLFTLGLAAPLWWHMVKQQTRCSICGTSRAAAKSTAPPPAPVQPATPAATAPSPPPARPTAASEMTAFYVEAANRETGEIKTFKVKASTPESAETTVAEAGYLISSIKPAPGDAINKPATAASSTPTDDAVHGQPVNQSASLKEKWKALPSSSQAVYAILAVILIFCCVPSMMLSLLIPEPAPSSSRTSARSITPARDVTLDAPPYTIVEREDISFANRLRLNYRVSVEGPVNEQEIRAICEQIIAREKERGRPGGITFFLYLPGTDTDGFYTAGKATWAPRGDWSRVIDNRPGDYSSHRLAIERGSPLGEVPEDSIAGHIPEEQRREIWTYLIRLEDDGVEFDEARETAARQYDVTVEDIRKVATEGGMSGWRMPAPAVDGEPQEANDPIIGRWRDSTPHIGATITIYRSNGQILMRQNFPDGSIWNVELVERPTAHGRRFEKKAGSSAGDHWLIDSRGNLQIRDDDGLIATARKIE